MFQKTPTQQEIAEKLGVSPTTLSLTLKDPDTTRVSESRRRQILDFVREHAPRLYPTKIRCRISLCLPEIGTYAGPVYGAIVEGVQKACRERDWRVDIRMGAGGQSREEILGDSPPDGVIAIVGRSPFEPLRELSEFVPVVLLNGRAGGEVCDTLDLDNGSGVRQLLNVLHREGHRRIAFLFDHETGEEYRHHLRDRAETFFGALLLQGVPFSNEDFINVRDLSAAQAAPAYDAALAKLLARADRPTAVVCFNDYCAANFINAVQRAGLRVPEDFSVTGYDDHSLSRQTDPQITTVHHDREQMGVEAVEALAHRIARPDSPRLILSQPAQLVLRGSHGAPADAPVSDVSAAGSSR